MSTPGLQEELSVPCPSRWALCKVPFLLLFTCSAPG